MNSGRRRASHRGEAAALDEPARAASPGSAELSNAVRSHAAVAVLAGMEPRSADAGGRPVRRFTRPGRHPSRLSRVRVGCISVAIWAFVRFTRSFLPFEVYGDNTFTP